MSTINVDTISEYTSSNGVYIAGHILQVVQGTFSTQSSSTSGTHADTGLSVAITPKSTSSKILVPVSYTHLRAHET